METYKNLSGNSGVESFEIGPDFVRVQFHDKPSYLYTDQSVGHENVEEMKRLARAGTGLSTFITQHPEVRDGYVRQVTDGLDLAIGATQ
jgi:hypothetical protein